MNAPPKLLYPSLVIAAVSVTVFSLLGIAGITGHLPAAFSQTDAGTPAAEAARAQAPAPAPAAQPAAPRQLAAAPCANCGVVESVRAVEVKGEGSGLGAVAGGLAGALIGNQMGGGNGRTAMTVIGAGGGAYAGHEIEKNVNRHTVWKVAVRMDDGSRRQLTLGHQPQLDSGARVRIVEGQLVPRNS